MERTLLSFPFARARAEKGLDDRHPQPFEDRHAERVADQDEEQPKPKRCVCGARNRVSSMTVG